MKLTVHYKKKAKYTWAILLILCCAKGVCQPKANFTSTTLSGCVPLIVSFQDSSTGNPTSWQWDLGNGIQSNEQNPSTSYFTPGTYTISLKVSNAAGSDSITIVNYITVYEKPIVNFSVSDSAGCFPLRVGFSDLSTSGSGYLSAWSWDFGDGDISSLQNPLHNYTASGIYSVTLKVTNSNGCSKVLSKLNYIKISTGVSVGFTNTSPQFCTPPETITFQNLSSGPPALTYQWDFGDGSSSIDSSPVHTYTNGGTYSVQLITKSSAGCFDTLLKQNTITIRNYKTDFSGPDSICISSLATFNNISVPAPISSSWDFGDTSNFTPDTITTSLTTITKTWNLPATYQVKLISNYGVCKDSVTKPVIAIPPPTPAFTTTDTINCKAPFTTQFKDLSVGGAAWLWNFGDGTTSTLQNPTHTYNSPGEFNVTLTVTNGLGCSSSITKNNFIKIITPNAGIYHLPLGACIPFTYNAISNIGDPKGVASYLWDFGDGTTSNLQSPSHIYTLTGTYTVKLFFTTNDGCSDSVVNVAGIRTGTPPTVNFTASPLSQCAGQNIQFTDLSTSANTWAWSFGDGASASTENPLHAFQTNGTFAVTLVAGNNGCQASLTKNNFITALPPVAKFTPEVNCADKVNVTFLDNSVLPQTWSWDFGDGNTSVSPSPTHTYATLNSYNVKLTVTNNGCTNTITVPIKLVDEHADFNTPKSSVCINVPIAFTAINSNPLNIVNYTFDFGDDSITNTKSGTATHVYSNPGTYTVKLTITDINGCMDSLTKTSYITVVGPTANFTAAPLTGCKGFTVIFTDKSTTDGVHPITNWQWTYGDGIIQNYSGPPYSHTFNSAGNFFVKLKVTDTNGCFDSIVSNSPIVITAPTAGFNSPDTIACTGSSVIFNNTSIGTNITYTWSLGNGITSNLATPVTSYLFDSSYTVKLIVTDINGCQDSLQQNNYIKITVPTAAFSINDSVGYCSPFEVDFTNNSINYLSQKWDFGDGSSSSAKNPVHYYSTPGSYTTILYAMLPGGCIDSFKRVIVLNSSNVVLKYIPLTGCKEVTVTFQVTSAGPVNYFWDFGDGNTISTKDSSVINNYQTQGSFVPKVIVTDPAGCQLLLTGSDTIRVIKSYVNFSVPDSITCPGTEIIFTNTTTSNAPISSWHWDFGDKETSSLQNPTHIYTSEGYYTVQLIATTNNGCIDTLVKTNYIKVNDVIKATIQGNTSACLGDSLSFAGINLNPETSSNAWQWNFGNGNTSSLQSPPAQQYPTAGDFPLQLIVSSSYSCPDTINETVSIHPIPTTNAGKDAIVCLDNTLQLNATGADNYIWSPSTYLSCTDCANPVTAPLNSIVYYVKGSTIYGCEKTDSIILTVKKPFTLTVTSTTNSLCQGQSAELTATGADEYSWLPQAGLNNPYSNNPIATPYSSTSYKVIGTDDANCFSDSAIVNISVFSYPAVNVGPDKNIPFGQTITLTPQYSQDVTLWLWSPSTGLSCTDCANPIASPQNSTIYTVMVTNSAGCSAQSKIAISFPCQVSIFIPNTFSPNNDGVNDVFYPRGKDIYLIQSMTIFDRWGEVVFQRSNFAPNVESLGWDGSFKGRPARL